MTTPIVVIGAGGFGRETLDVIDAINQAAPGSCEVIGVIDDHPSDANLGLLRTRGVSYLGTINQWLRDRRQALYVVGIGSNSTRQSIAERLDSAGLNPVTVVHPAATIGPFSTLDAGCIVCAGVRITNNVVVGRHTHLNLNVTVGHDAVLGRYVSINPLVAVSGDCVLEDGVMMGTGSVILQGIRMGRGSTAGASACVIRDVPDGQVVKGIPAR